MCIVVEANARLSDTTLYAAEVLHPTEGVVHVVGYQNVVQGSSGGPNAMILPLPSDEPLGPDNVLDVASLGLSKVMGTYQKAVEAMKPRLRSRAFGRGDVTKGLGMAAADSFQVFNSGAYTIALAERAAGLVKALRLVPTRKRPNINTRFLIGLAEAYPKTPLAVCCFNADDFQSAGKPEPLFWWYKPRDPKNLLAPAIDAHDGEPPKNNPAQRDHTVVFGSYRAEGVRDGGGVAKDLPQHWALTPAIVGSQVMERTTANGDFTLPVDALLDARVPGYIGADMIKVASPPGWV